MTLEKNYEVFMHFHDDTEKRFYLEFDLFEETVAADSDGAVFMVTDDKEVIELTQVKYVEVINLKTKEVIELDESEIEEWMIRIRGAFLIQ